MRILFICCFFYGSTFAQNIEKIDSGSLNGAAYKILFPKNWKGKLVMYTHGYEFDGSTHQSSSPRFLGSMKPFLERGFAVAASDYSIQGAAFTQGVENTEELRKYFFKKYGTPDTCYVVGHSMGGGIAIATIENFGKYYNGGLPLCPLSSRPYLQCRKEFDEITTFNALFPGVIHPTSEIFDLSKKIPANNPKEMISKIMAIHKAIVAKDSMLGVSFAQHFNLKFSDLAFSLYFDTYVLRDISQKLNGNPFDNTNTIYSGFSNDWDINKKVERMQANVSPNVLFGKYDRTGNIDRPVLMMHTIYDQLIPPTYGEVNYENMIHQNNKDALFVVKYTNGQGHCNFSEMQIGEVFDELRTWVKAGVRAKPGIVE
jgi:pimeloyl-ACP methyl ester carboxylesterase